MTPAILYRVFRYGHEPECVLVIAAHKEHAALIVNQHYGHINRMKVESVNDRYPCILGEFKPLEQLNTLAGKDAKP